MQNNQRLLCVGARKPRFEDSHLAGKDDSRGRNVSRNIRDLYDGDDLTELIEVHLNVHGTHTRMWYWHVSVPSLRMVT